MIFHFTLFLIKQKLSWQLSHLERVNTAVHISAKKQTKQPYTPQVIQQPELVEVTECMEKQELLCLSEFL